MNKSMPIGSGLTEMLEQDMSYIVVYQRADGSSGVEECGDMDLAIVTAERLRNVDSVERPRIFKTEEIRYDFRPYYRVEVVKDEDVESTTPAPSVASTTSRPFGATAPAPAPETVEPPEPVEVVSTVASGDVEPITETDAVEAMSSMVEAEASPLDKIDDPEPSNAVAQAAAEATTASDKLAAPPLPPSVSKGLFGTQVAPETNEFADVVEEATPEAEVEQPRRGLFGR